MGVEKREYPKASMLHDYWRNIGEVQDKEKELTEFLTQEISPTARQLRRRLMSYVTYVESRLGRMIEIAKTIMRIEKQSVRDVQELEKNLRDTSAELRASFATGVPFDLIMYLGSEFMRVRNQIVDKVTFQLAFGHLVSEREDSLLNLLAIANFLDVDLNWAYSAIALQLHEVAIKKISEKMCIKLDRKNIEEILGKKIDLGSAKFMPFNYQYEAFCKAIKKAKKIDMPELVKDMRSTRTRVLHLGHKPTSGETRFIIGFTEDLLEKLSNINANNKS